MLTSPFLLLQRHLRGDLLTDIIRIGFYFIIGQTLLPSRKAGSLLAEILGLEGTHHIHSFPR